MEGRFGAEIGGGQNGAEGSASRFPEFGNRGRIGMIPGYPGEKAYPPQPMVKQTRHFMEQYKSRGGRCIELVIPGGHVCILESPMQFITALDTFVSV